MNIRRMLRYLKIAHIDVLIYKMDQANASVFPPTPWPFQKSYLRAGKRLYLITDNGKFVHNSFVFPKLHLLKLIGKKGPAIGDCATSTGYRGQSIYPSVINAIARELLAEGESEVFIVVNSDNISSIKGIDKAGFKKHAAIKAKRFTFLYFDKNIRFDEKSN